MKYLHKYGTRSNEMERARRELYFRVLMIAAVFIFFGIMVVISQFRPRLENEADLKPPVAAGDPLQNPSLIRLRSQVEERYQAFMQAQLEGRVDMEHLDLLEQAIDLQRDVISSRGSEIAPKVDLDKLEELLGLYDEQMSLFLIAQSERLEAEARELWKAGETNEALQALRRARNLQEEINEQYPRSSSRNPSRLHQLENQFLIWQTEPLAEQADSLKARALELVEAGRHAEAREAIQEGLEKQEELNQRFRNSPFATLYRLKEFERAWTSVHLAEEVERIRTLEGEAEILLNTGQSEEALDRATRAETLQRAIMERYPTAPEAQPARLREIRVLKDTAASILAFDEWKTRGEEVRRLLREQEIEPFQVAVSDWLRATEQFVERFPLSEYTGRIDVEEVRYLRENRDILPTLLDTVYPNLLPVSGYPGTLLFRTEIPQALYEQVMGENPSNHVGPQLPVDSVTWEEANRFARNLSWVLARPVRLPDRALYRAALGAPEEANLSAQAWSSGNSDRETRQVGSLQPNAEGFHDLLGNVAEWVSLSAGDTETRILAIGGSARDTTLRLAEIPEEYRDANERNRFVGFRIAVETAP